MSVTRTCLTALLSGSLLLASCATAQPYPLAYHVRLLPDRQLAQVRIELPSTDLVKQIDFNLANSRCTDFVSDEPLQQQDTRLIWQPVGKGATLSYHCTIPNRRASSDDASYYDALITADWALFRGDDLVPPAKVLTVKGAESVATLSFQLPQGWRSVNTEWPRDHAASSRAAPQQTIRFRVDNPARRFDRPTGWIIAGKLGTRRAVIGSGDSPLQIAVSAPRGSALRRMDILTFVHFVWPTMQKAFHLGPQRLLIVGGDEPLWRGGLSAPNSLYLHATRPIVSENGTSPLVHELFHTLTGIRGKKNNDWIAEGLAEYYSIQLLHRAGGMEQARLDRIFKGLAEWSAQVDSIRRRHATGKVTAAAVLLFKQLDEEIQQLTEGHDNLDTLVRRLMAAGDKVATAELDTAFQEITGQPSKTLRSPLL